MPLTLSILLFSQKRPFSQPRGQTRHYGLPQISLFAWARAALLPLLPRPLCRFGAAFVLEDVDDASLEQELESCKGVRR